MEKFPGSDLGNKLKKLRNKATLIAGLVMPASLPAQQPIIRPPDSVVESHPMMYPDFKTGYSFKVNYIGPLKQMQSRLEDRESKNSKWNPKIDSLAAGINHIEGIFQKTNLIGSALIVELFSTYKDFQNLGLSSGLLILAKGMDDHSGKFWAMAAEHETIHAGTKDRGYDDTKSLSKVFDKLKQKRDSFPPFMLFINESNYIGLPEDYFAGHSQDDIHELLASFVHSVLNIDLLGKNIQKEYIRNSAHIIPEPVDSNSEKLTNLGEKVFLTPQIRLEILNNYTILLSEIMKIEKEKGEAGKGPSILYSKFQTALNEIENVRTELLSQEPSLVNKKS